MIRPLNIELRILVYILAYGIYYFAISDLVIYIEERCKLKKIPKLILEFLYLISQVYLTYNFCYKLESGYIPIYFLLFIVIGFLLYYLFMRDYFFKSLNICVKLLKKLKPFCVHALYSVTILKGFFNVGKKFCKKLITLFRKKENNCDKENQNT